MAATDLVIVGCGGHGREVLDAVNASNSMADRWNVLGFVDDDPQHLERIARLNQNVLGPVEWLKGRSTHYVFGIGSSAIRAKLAGRLDAWGHSAATVIHPDATIGADVDFGDGVVVFARSVVTTNVRVGRHSHVNVGCAVQHDTEIGEFVQVSPGVFINGDCTIGNHAFLGTGAIVTRGCSVGRDAVVGAGAVVLRDVPAAGRVVGVPARPDTVSHDSPRLPEEQA